MAGDRGSAGRGTLLSGFPLGGNGSFVALATSGTAQRGDHIWRAGVGRTEFRRTEFRQVSVAATDIVTADVLATAVVAGGRRMLDWATNSWDVEVLAVLGNGNCSDARVPRPGARAAAARRQAVADDFPVTRRTTHGPANSRTQRPFADRLSPVQLRDRSHGRDIDRVVVLQYREHALGHVCVARGGHVHPVVAHMPQS